MSSRGPHSNRFSDSRQATDVNKLLGPILQRIAYLLLRDGYAFNRLNKLAKLAFIEAARNLDAGNSKSRTNIASIAAVTGLTRVEVSHLLAMPAKRRHEIGHLPNRAIRVIEGWVSDSNFVDRSRHPKKLRFAGTKVSFQSLVKKYSGDIPPRAMLQEMERLGVASRNVDGSIVLKKRALPESKRTAAAIRAISPWVNLILMPDAEGKIDAPVSHTRQLRLRFASLAQAAAAVREFDRRRDAFVGGLHQLGGLVNPEGAYEITISVAVASTKPVPTIDARKLRSRRSRK